MEPKVLQCNGNVFTRFERFHGEIRFFDVCGFRISSRDVEANLKRCRDERASRKPARRHDRARRWKWDAGTFRRGPVPLTGYGRGGNAFVGPAIFREQKDSDFLRFDEDCLEHGVRPRGWRRAYLPAHLWWDNWSREQWRDRSWKRHRRNQWKD
jgi:hypothetical protein